MNETTKGVFSILGSGASSSTPWLQCLISGANCCAVCDDCRRNPSTSKNIRNNVSALLSVPSLTPGAEPLHVMLDAGKTMRQSVMKWFPAFGVQALAAVVLTHPHADAFLGLDDLRDLSPRRVLPVYLSKRCFEVVKRVFSYLVPEGSVAKRSEKCGYGLYSRDEDAVTGSSSGGAAAICAPATTFVAMIEWRIFNEWEPFVIPEANNIVVTPVPVQHGAGRDNISFAFEFGLRLGENEKEGLIMREEKKVRYERDSENNIAAASLQQQQQQQHAVTEFLSGEKKFEVVAAAVVKEKGDDDNDNNNVVGDDDKIRMERSIQPLSSEPGMTTSMSTLQQSPTSLSLPSFMGSRILYISDVSSISPTARHYFRARETDLLILDLLNYARYSTHFNAQQAVNCAADIRASKIRFVGINHAMDHEVEDLHMRSIGMRLKEGKVDMGLAQDGLRFSFTLGSISSETGLESLKREIASVRSACDVPGREEDDPSLLVDYYSPILTELLPENSPTKTKFGKR